MLQYLSAKSNPSSHHGNSKGIHAAYQAILKHYGEKTAKRSRVPLINHIDEGLIILDRIGASLEAQAAYCIHPIVQSDEALRMCFIRDSDEEQLLKDIDVRVIILALEYRSSANSYLSHDKPEDLKMSPLPEVRDMLIADKIQNYKDFTLHHLGTHPRSAELKVYFENWLKILEISKEQYHEFTKLIS